MQDHLKNPYLRNPSDLWQLRSNLFPRRPFSSSVALAFCEWTGCLSQSVQWRTLGEKEKKKNLYFFILHSLKGLLIHLRGIFHPFWKKVSVALPSVQAPPLLPHFSCSDREQRVSIENRANNAATPVRGELPCLQVTLTPEAQKQLEVQLDHFRVPDIDKTLRILIHLNETVLFSKAHTNTSTGHWSKTRSFSSCSV